MTLRTYVVGSNLLEFRDLRKARDSEKLKARDQALLEAVYDELFTPNFPDPDEQETLADWTPRLWGNPTQERPRQAERHVFVARTHLDDPKASSLAGFAFVERYPESRCALLSYIAVDPHARGKGIARKLFSKARGSAERAARDEGHPLGAVFAEIHDPHRVTDDVIDASDRVRIMAKLGARLVPIRYVQPALGKHGERSDRHMLIAFPMDGEHSLDGSVICGFLREYYATLGLPAHDADLKDAEQALGKGSVELAPLGTSLDFEEFGVALHFVAKPRKKPKRLEILKRDLVALLRQRSLASARAVTINGIPTVGTKTTLTAGTYEAPPTGRSYQWQFCEPGYAHCADIPDATNPTYTPVDTTKAASCASWRRSRGSVTKMATPAQLPQQWASPTRTRRLKLICSPTATFLIARRQDRRPFSRARLSKSRRILKWSHSRYPARSSTSRRDAGRPSICQRWVPTVDGGAG